MYMIKNHPTLFTHLNPIKIHIQYLWSEKSKSVLKVMMYTSRQTMKTKAGEILGYSYWNRIEYSK